MSEIRCIYVGSPPAFPATDQHPDAVRYRIEVANKVYFVDAVGGAPTIEQVEAALQSPVPSAARALDRHLSEAIAEFTSPAPSPSQPTSGNATMTSPAAAGLNVREMMEEHTRMMGEIHKAQLELLRSSLARQRDTLSTAVASVAQKIDGQTDEFLSIMGQFSNDLGLD